MKTLSQKREEGFTIIEVVLVLAIAALIFLIVFLALPALQRSQRDTQRRNDVGRIVAQVSNFQANGNGQVPTNSFRNGEPAFGDYTSGGFFENYVNIDGTFVDPNGEDYDFSLNDPTEVAELQYQTGRICGGGGITQTNAGARNIAVRVWLEGGGIYCQDNL